MYVSQFLIIIIVGVAQLYLYFFLFQVQAMSKEKPKVQEYVLIQYLNPYDNSIIMNPYVCMYMYIYTVTQHEKCHRYDMHLFMILKVHSVIHVHDFKCTFSNSVYS